MSMIKNGTLMSAQNKKSATAIQSRPPMSKIKNGHLCLKIEKRLLMSEIKNQPFVPEIKYRPGVQNKIQKISLWHPKA